MPFIDINGAQIYYQTYGEDHPGQAPILLIHGSTITGEADWSQAAPLLARNWKVIVPDCRGHGRSSNPNLSYSFSELAADMATLVRALGYERAHILGHSNGGNVALVVLMEHPEVVQTAIPQAANAYVSQDLIDKEPRIFEPERVARESPAWMNEMIELHGPTHGPDYWRDLLRLTVHAIISEPNYTPADLAQVQRPTLVIQGELDSVNAPARHAQFIARHIPHAELWIPEGIGHGPHREILFEWINKIEDFLRRRGDEANEALYRLGRERYADRRLNIFELRAAPAEQDPVRLALSGRTLTAEQRDAAVARLEALGAQVDASDVRVLLDDAPWALVKRSHTDLRRHPQSLSEMVSQALLGESLRILETHGEWALVRTERHGYLGWLSPAALAPCTAEEARRYQAAVTHIVQAELAPTWETPERRLPVAGKLPFGVCLPVVAEQNGLAQVRLPGGELRWTEAAGLLPLSERPALDARGIAAVLDLMKRFTGVPYLWGGRTPFGFDCSGFAGAFYAFLGVTIPRDADMQFRAGLPVEGEPQPGDLLFFGTREADAPGERSVGSIARVTHVAISLGGWEFIHATSAAGGVTFNSLDPASPIYRAGLKDSYLDARRFG